MRVLWEGLKELRRYPSALAGLGIIAGLVGLALYAVVAIPYNEAIRLWRGGEGIWLETPRNAQPRWVNLLQGMRLPETLVVSSQGVSRRVEALSPGVRAVEMVLGFDYTYDDFPSELTVFFTTRFRERPPHVALRWRTPDGREIPLGEPQVGSVERYSLSLDRQLERRLGGPPEVKLFADPRTQRPMPGRYELSIEGLLFEAQGQLEARLVLYGKVHGLAGTDHRRRDLMVALLWGAPVALAFGFLAAVGSSLSSLFIAAIGAWYGRWVDAVIQRLTEVNLILPALPILIMIGTFYSRSIWVMMGVIIVLGIFGSGIKVYRAIFLQVKEEPYIEAARAYGAGNLRIVFRYMAPRVLPVLVPGFVTLIPSLVFLEASLAILGLGDPVLPTWGKVLQDAFQNGALYKGHYYWVLGPSILLMLTGLGFALVGFALDRIFNPRLRRL